MEDGVDDRRKDAHERSCSQMECASQSGIAIVTAKEM
jgi:hypothetical protein